MNTCELWLVDESCQKDVDENKLSNYCEKKGKWAKIKITDDIVETTDKLEAETDYEDDVAAIADHVNSRPGRNRRSICRRRPNEVEDDESLEFDVDSFINKNS
ncbi:2867_t:CDS:2 [Ambispora leptoticha]|uniref:2867_t:CDS:1 n=1 Tax=Ambispora leptoticha TaxID=144679 RepID=A0A9N8WQE3_9GLOM|nr:2867_t:CDS:2 [Ambispora leptoticha]